jgi:CRP-like cAMP-binding protein
MTLSLLSPVQPIEHPSRRLAPRALLMSEPKYVWRIDSGVVRSLTWSEDGSIVVLGIWGAGDIVSSDLTGIEPCQIECLTKVEVTALPKHLWQHEPSVLLAHLKQTEEFLMIRSQRRTEETLLRLLNWLAKKFGRESATGQLIDVRLTHQDIAEMIGSTRVTITRLLAQLEQQGLIQRLPLHRIVLKEEELWHYEI